jgi:hypothetical protein
VTATFAGSVYLVDSPRRLPAGTLLGVMLDQNVMDRFGSNHPSPHLAGRCEVLADGRLALSLTRYSEAGRTARGLLDIDALDVTVEGDPPVVGCVHDPVRTDRRTGQGDVRKPHREPPEDSSNHCRNDQPFGGCLHRFDQEVRTDQVIGYTQLEPVVCLNK